VSGDLNPKKEPGAKDRPELQAEGNKQQLSIQIPSPRGQGEQQNLEHDKRDPRKIDQRDPRHIAHPSHHPRDKHQPSKER
jgi:hypothetical protein